jgi:hypothetical protein
MHDLCVIGKIHNAIFHLVARSTLHLAPDAVLHLALYPTLGA